jgi:hypothetical protein
MVCKDADFRTDKTGDRKKDHASIGKGPRKNDGSFAWKDVAPKEGEPKKKAVKGKTYFWCTHHTNPMWALHNPDSFPNLCRLHPKFAELELAWTSKGGSPTDSKGAPTAADMKMERAMAAIQDSDDDSDDDEGE